MASANLSDLRLSLLSLDRPAIWTEFERIVSSHGTLIIDLEAILHIISQRTRTTGGSQSTLTPLVETEDQLMDLIRAGFRRGTQLKPENDPRTGKARIPFVSGFDSPVGYQDFNTKQPLHHLRLSAFRKGNKVWKLKTLLLEPCIKTACSQQHGTDAARSFVELLAESATP
jgi:hypothetical protein